MKKYNFSAGPSILDESVIKDAASAVLNYEGTGLSILEVSHRGKEFVATMEQARQAMRDLLNIPEGYEVLFLGGGASLQFTQVAMNLLKTKAAYIDSGTWANKAAKEAKLFGEVIEFSSKADNYVWYPKPWNEVPEDVDYLHFTSNNTVYGTQLRYDPDVKCRLVGDMSSDIFTREIDFSKYDLIYGGAQKNIAPAGATFVIVRRDALGHVDRPLPTMLDYRTHVDKDSMYNTPPVFPVYVALQTMKWYKELGGVKVLEQMNIEKSNLLYNEIDRNKLFRGTVKEEDRSMMNVCFVMNDEYQELNDEFFKFATERGITSFKGHRTVGGFRASLYNAMPKESVQYLVDLMKEFERKH